MVEPEIDNRGLSLLAKWSTKFATGVLFFAVAVAPLPFGSADNSAMAFWSVVLGLVLIAAPLKGLRKSHFVLIGCFAFIVIAYAAILHEQLAPKPWFALSGPHPLWREASQALGEALRPSASIARNEPFFALGSPVDCMLALLCGFLIGTDRARARNLLWVIAISGVVYAVYGIVSHVNDPTHILWREKASYRGDLTGTFINRNTAAVYFGSCAIACLMLVCDRIRRELPRGPIAWRQLPSQLLSHSPRGVVLTFSMLFLCAAAMFMTGSRAGVVLSLMAMIMAFTTFFRRDLPGRGGITTALIMGAGLALVLLQFMGAGVNARFGAQGLADEGRLSAWRAALRMIADRPWLGSGQGTFVWAFPAYRSDDISMVGVWDRAHNTLLELAADMGLPLAALVAVGWMLIFAILIYGVRSRQRDVHIPVAALSVATVAILHSLVDFSLQIVGYAIPTLALIGAGLAQSLGTDRRFQQTAKSPVSDRSHYD